MKKLYIYLTIIFLFLINYTIAEQATTKTTPAIKTVFSLGFAVASNKAKITSYLANQEDNFFTQQDYYDFKGKNTVSYDGSAAISLNISLDSNFLTYQNTNFTKNLYFGLNAVIISNEKKQKRTKLDFESQNYLITALYEYNINQYFGIRSGLGVGLQLNKLTREIKYRAFIDSIGILDINIKDSNKKLKLTASPKIATIFYFKNFNISLEYQYVYSPDIKMSYNAKKYTNHNKTSHYDLMLLESKFSNLSANLFSIGVAYSF